MPAPGQLTHVTLTGVDDRTPLSALAELSYEFPLVEWGFLYSPDKAGAAPLYPSVSAIKKALRTLPGDAQVALHVCGRGVAALLRHQAELDYLVALVAARDGRVQLNFNQARNPIPIYVLLNFLHVAYKLGLRVITPHNLENEGVTRELLGAPGHSVLFDASRGTGRLPEMWPVPLPRTFCGYAGGLGPDNLAIQLRRIQQVAAGAPFWIDMQKKLRTDNWFDLNLARACLEQAMSLVPSPRQVA